MSEDDDDDDKQDWLGELLGRYTTLERDGCVCDCESVIQYVRKGLGVRSEEVLLLGHSIGAAFSAQAAAMAHPNVNVCNSRSFSSLSVVVEALAPLFFGLDGTSALSTTLRRIGQNARAIVRAGEAYRVLMNGREQSTHVWVYVHVYLCVGVDCTFLRCAFVRRARES